MTDRSMLRGKWDWPPVAVTRPASFFSGAFAGISRQILYLIPQAGASRVRPGGNGAPGVSAYQA